MKSLEERKAARNEAFINGPGPVVISPDPKPEPEVLEEERDPVRNKFPGSSRTVDGKPLEVVEAGLNTGNGSGVADTASTSTSVEGTAKAGEWAPNKAKQTKV